MCEEHSTASSSRGELEEGARLARKAGALATETDMLNAHGDVLLDLAEVLTLAGQDGRAELEQAIALYERKVATSSWPSAHERDSPSGRSGKYRALGSAKTERA